MICKIFANFICIGQWYFFSTLQNKLEKIWIYYIESNNKLQWIYHCGKRIFFEIQWQYVILLFFSYLFCLVLWSLMEYFVAGILWQIIWLLKKCFDSVWPCLHDFNNFTKRRCFTKFVHINIHAVNSTHRKQLTELIITMPCLITIQSWLRNRLFLYVM